MGKDDGVTNPTGFECVLTCFLDTGAKVHCCLCCFLEASGKAPHPWFVTRLNDG